MVAILNSGRSRAPHIMDLLWFLVLISMKHNFFLRAHHVPRLSNEIADACSPSLPYTVSAMRSYFLAACPSGPLFSFQSGRYLTRSVVVHLLRDAAQCAGLPYKSLKGHSFRIGAASTATATGLPIWLIKVLGRWSSDCYQLYIHTPKNVLMSAAQRMASILVS